VRWFFTDRNFDQKEIRKKQPCFFYVNISSQVSNISHISPRRYHFFQMFFTVLQGTKRKSQVTEVVWIEAIHWVPWLCGQTLKQTVISWIKTLTTVKGIYKIQYGTLRFWNTTADTSPKLSFFLTGKMTRYAQCSAHSIIILHAIWYLNSLFCSVFHRLSYSIFHKNLNDPLDHKRAQLLQDVF
jgi:hypothetical protein